MRSRRPRTVLRNSFALAIALLLLVLFGYPLVWLVLSSFKTQSEFVSGSPWALPEQFDLDNYVFALTEGDLGHYALNSVLVTLPSLALTLALGVAAGFALEVLVFRGRGLLLLLFLAGIMIPAQMILLPLFNAYFALGLTSTYWPMILTYTATGLPLTVFMMSVYFRSLPRQLLEAAALDGASTLRFFFAIALPASANAIVTVGLIQFFFIWNDLLIALTFGNSRSLSTIQVGLLGFSGEFGAVQYGPLLAAISLSVLVILVLYLFLNRRIMRGLVDGAVKG